MEKVTMIFRDKIIRNKQHHESNSNKRSTSPLTNILRK